MIQKDDWRLMNDVEYLKNKEINPTDGEELAKNAPYLKECIFCWEKVRDNFRQWWYLPTDMSCCICEECYNDFKDMFNWRKLDGWDIDWTMRCPKCHTELKVISNQDYVYSCENCNILYDENFEDELQLEKHITDWREEALMKSLYEIDGFLTEDIQNIDTFEPHISEKVLSVLLEWACYGQNTAGIILGRKCIAEIPKQWLQEHLLTVVKEYFDYIDDWNYRRLLELVKEQIPELLNDIIAVNSDTDNPHLLDVIEDYR